ncbi:MAG TPA: OmpA family protein [Kofleriaceae bacterium]|jgi:cysteine-rich repeat protein
MRNYFGLGTLLTSLIFSCTSAPPDPKTGQTQDDVIAGSFQAGFDDTLTGGGYVVAGVGLAGREDLLVNLGGTITVTGVPATASVHRALLYWAESNATDASATFAGHSVTGTLIGTGGETCWAAHTNVNRTYRADVTAYVPGNGSYTISDLPSGILEVSPDTDGAGLLVEYEVSGAAFTRRIVIRDGAITTSAIGDTGTDTFTGLSVPTMQTGKLGLVVGDGQVADDDATEWGFTNLGNDQWGGAMGSMWDMKTYPVALAMNATSGTWSSVEQDDCLLYVAGALSYLASGSTGGDVCGDGQVGAGEGCDDGNTLSGDGCDSQCNVETGFTCTGSPSVCTMNGACGNGVVAGGEQCDDGNTTNGDGCDSTCHTETGWTCTGSPSVCTTDCGDGIVAGGEACDDGNTTGGDGCDGSCHVETGFTCTGSPSVCTTGGGSDGGTGDGGTGDGDGGAGNGDGGGSNTNGLEVAGGACNAAGNNGSWLAIVMIAFLAMVCLRRRSTQAIAAATGLTLALAGTAKADPRDIPAERFQLSMDKDGLLSVENPRSTGWLTLDVGLWLGYADNPLSVRQTGSDHDEVAKLVSHRLGAGLAGALGLGRYFEIGVQIPLVLDQGQDPNGLSTSSLTSAGLGDISVTPKLSLLRGSFDLAIAAQVSFPSSSSTAYLGETDPTVAPMLVLGIQRESWRILGDVGYRIRKAQPTTGLEIDDEAFADIGLGVRVAHPIELMLTYSVATKANDLFGASNEDFSEGRLGVGIDVTDHARIFAAGGAGFSSGWGTPDWRALVGVWLGHGKEKKPAPAPVAPPPVIGDRDGDGILDNVDKCPDEPETKNGYQDEDGCPDTLPDTDGDGIPDNVDKCPTEPEDKDGFEDDDGCPDPDNDKDGVMDTADRCPMEPGPVENGGCPDTDRDGDGIVDRLDNCPDEKGTKENHGCKEKQLVVFNGTSIALLDTVYFKLDKADIDARSNKLLANVASVLKAHPEVTGVTVEGHTDSQGDDAYNMDLSQRRAQAVVDFLVKAGVPVEKLKPVGYGETRPIADNKTPRGRAANRRVEFKLAGIAAIQTAPPGPPAENIEKK